MKSRLKHFLSLFLSLLIVLQLISTTAFANTEENTEGINEMKWNPDSNTMNVTQVLSSEDTLNGQKYSNYRIPGIVTTNQDTIIMYYEARMTSSDWAYIDILAFRSTDGGTTWDEPITLAAGADAGLTMNNPIMIVGNDNTLHFLYCVEYGTCTSCGTSASSLCTHGAGVFYRKSIDDGITWSEPINISDSTSPDMRNVIATGPGHGIALANGTLVIPVWLVKKEENASLQSHFPSNVTTLYSTDNGVSWQLGEIVPNNSGIPSPNETMAVECSDGSVMLNIRTHYGGYRAVCWSPNGYSDWSSMEYDTTLIDPTCMGSVTKYDIEGDPYTILFTNCESTNSRGNLVLKGSTDNGRTWNIRKVIDAGVAGYSDVTVDSKGTIYVLYEVNYGETINLARLNYDCFSFELNATLSDLKIKGISEGIKFNSATEEYTITANYGDKITVIPTLYNLDATIKINDKEYVSGKEFEYQFTKDFNTIKIDIAYGELTKTYTLNLKPAKLPETLVFYLNGETEQDQTVYQNAVTLNETMKINNEKYAFGNGCYEFDGKTGDSAYITVNSFNGFDFGTENFTFSTWVCFDSLVSRQVVFWYGSVGGGLSQLWCRSNGSDLQCCLSSGGKETVLTASNALTANKWHNVVIIRNEKKFYMYLDTELVAEKNCPYVYDLELNSMNIGASKYNPPNGFIDGCIDEFKIYNYVLCERQIKSLYENNTAEKSEHMIYQFDPWKIGQKEGTDVTARTSDDYESIYKTYVRKNNDGYYYSTEAQALSTKTYSYINSGYNENNFPILGNAEIISKLLPYMQISVDVRVISEAPLTEDIEFSIMSMPNSEQYFSYAEGTVVGDGEWHTFTKKGTTGSLSDYYQGTLGVALANMNDSPIKFEFRNLTVSLKVSDQETIDTMLANTEFSYDSLTYYVENDVNNDEKFDVLDLVRLKKITSGIISHTQNYVLDRIDKDETGYINAQDLTNIRIALLKN